jgi:hypothetical protein
MQFHIAKDGQQSGPFPESEVREMLRAGSISPNDLAWHEGMTAWTKLSDVLKLPSPGMSAGAALALVSPVRAAPSFAGAIFLYIPISRFVFLSLISLGFFEAYWVYRNWRYLKERDGMNIWSFWRGFFAVIFILPLLHAIKKDPVANRISRAAFDPTGLGLGWLSLVVVGRILDRMQSLTANVIGLIIALPSFCFLLPVQRYINSINEALPSPPQFYKWSSGQVVCLVLGLIFWVLILIGISAG